MKLWHRHLLAALLATLNMAAFQPQEQEPLPAIEQQLKQQPGNPRLLAARGVLLGKAGRDDEGLKSFDAALRISPKFLLALEGAAEVAYRHADERAASYVRRILQLDPSNQVANAMAGTLAFDSRQCETAIGHFERAGNVALENSLALRQWGECLIAGGHANAAAERLRRSLLLTDNGGARFDLARALLAGGDLEGAFQTAAKLKGSAEVLNLRASIYVRQNKFAEAVAAYRAAIQMKPGEEQNYIDLVSLCLDHQSLNAAAEIVNAGLTVLPKSSALYTLRGAIEAQFSRTDRAAADFDKARELEPDQIYSDAGLSLLLEQQTDIDKAIATIRPRLRDNPSSAPLHFLLGDLLLKRSEATNRDRSEAVTHLREAVRLDASLARAHALLGKELLRSGKAEAAIGELNTALRLDPGDRIALNQLIIAYRQSGLPEKARAAAIRLQQSLAQARQSEVEKNRTHFTGSSEATR